MSDYTPTTEEVESGYANNRFISEHGQDEAQRIFVEEFGKVLDFRNEYVAELHRWLAEVKAQEAKAERECIIALLEEQLHSLHKGHCCDGCDLLLDNIARIKGETE